MTNEEYKDYKRFYECIKHFNKKSEFERKHCKRKNKGNGKGDRK